MKRETKIIVFILCLLSIYLIRTALTPYSVEIVDDRNLYDFDHYVEISKWFLCMPNIETAREYQYPPLYPILIAPTQFLDTHLYLLILDNIFVSLTFIPLFLLLSKWVSFNTCLCTSYFLIIFNFAFSPKAVGFPIAISTLLFTCFIYFLYDVDKKLKYSSILFALLIATKYLFFFLSPMIFVWLYFRIEKSLRLKTTILFFIPSFIVFSLWSCRNILLHGLSIKGAIGGYESTLSHTDPFLNVPIGLVPAKFTSIFTEFYPSTVLNYFVIFIFGFVALIYFYHKRPKIFKKLFNLKLYHFYMVLMINFIIFIFTLGLTYHDEVFHWRYFTYILLIYVSLGLLPFLKIIEYRKSRYKKK